MKTNIIMFSERMNFSSGLAKTGIRSIKHYKKIT